LVALTSNDEVNSLAALHFIELFGRAQVYQLPTRKNGVKDAVSHHLRGRILFGEDYTYRELAAHFLAGKVIKKTAITHEFTYDRFRATYGDEIIPLFIVSGRGEVTIVTADAKVAPSAGQSIIALVNRLGETAFDKDRSSGAASDNDAAPVSFA
jgi:hypothetical protein